MRMSSEDEKNDGVSSANGYDVFMSFSGVDTRQGFADCFYHVMREANIHVFRDEEELHVGKEIRHNLQRAIENSKIYAPIFSENYASSSSCLRELAYMVKCKKSKPFEKMILPIFYNVEPRDVMLKSELYTSALAKHEEKFGRQTTRAWADGLRSVAQIKGMEVKKQGYAGVLNHSINF
ncbi:disease resistance protein L6-like [Syzygium oleosum]|uniref:disease resistance protein L6-like n=1 Tax=Syzygium oleosum TaxID=219896 RepID=UPI0024BA946C|nr:disease resistance protein L6-like [Syzygium oleosum]